MRREDGLDTMLEGQVWTELQQAVARFRAAWARRSAGDRGVLAARERPSGAVPGRAGSRGAGTPAQGGRPSLRPIVPRPVRRTEIGPPHQTRIERGRLVLADAGPALRARASATVAGPVSVGRYELGEIIGRGAFGVVHRAWDTLLRRTVALKRPRPGARRDAEAVERFLREARAAAGLRHPHIVPVHDAGQVDGELYLVSDLIEGRNLADELAARRPGFRRSAEWVAALAEALEHAHSFGVIHRDVKPSNVLIDAEDRVYLTDFGLAKSDSGEATLTADGQVIGTPAYMAPEQARAATGAVDGRTDVYSLGVILYELLTGSRPFAGHGPMLLLADPGGGAAAAAPARRRDPARPRDDLPEGDGQGAGASLRLARPTSRPISADGWRASRSRPARGTCHDPVAEMPAEADALRSGGRPGSGHRRGLRRRDVAMAAGRNLPPPCRGQPH